MFKPPLRGFGTGGLTVAGAAPVKTFGGFASVLSYSDSKRYGFVNSLNRKELTKICISPFV
jgi:hypothetical protein